MTVSVFELFKIGIGPSSSHTVGPMKAARAFLQGLEEAGELSRVARLSVSLHGSLAATGRGHASDTAVLLGLAGEEPETVDPDRVPAIVAGIGEAGRIALLGRHEIPFLRDRDIRFNMRERMRLHANGMRFLARDGDGRDLAAAEIYSIGGGFVATAAELAAAQAGGAPDGPALPFDFASAAAMLAQGEAAGLRLSEMMQANERSRGLDDSEIGERLARIAAVMAGCIDRGLAQEGILPGGLKVRRRAAGLLARAEAQDGANRAAMPQEMARVSAWAIAVNEENAAGGRVVTAPTNGAAGIIPAVLRHLRLHCGGDDAAVAEFLLAAAAIGALIKRNAAISGAELGCQGEVGSACAMAAAGLAAALGGSNAQVENAAEIGLEHHLGMTCDPIAGLVQVPCIERNAMGAVTAINAASLALAGDGAHLVPLDAAIETMRQTGRDMKAKYRETSRGGLAVNVPNC
ncbi:L-serine ammonia-lyase [Marinibaculum pumilum]|uniref:L-serine dehydratase n=1 Tax=Marinibaculum pumilum TaxID=1766165 RepID=A0ABV7L9A4_9PROT